MVELTDHTGQKHKHNSPKHTDMKTNKELRERIMLVGVIIALIGLLIFVGGLIASSMVWHPGTPSEVAQTLTMFAGCGFLVAALGTCIVAMSD